MAAEEEIMKIRLDADLSGGVATEKQYDRLIAKAKDLGKQGSASAGQATSAIGRLQQATGKLRQALAGFGVAGLFSALIAQVGKIAESFGAAKKQAEEFAKVQQKLAEAKGVQQLATDYERLKDAVSAAAAEQSHALDMIDEDVKNRRRLEKAQRGAAKEKELAALDPSDPAYAQKVAQINARYASEDAAAAASDAREDVTLQQQRLETQAGLKDQEASAQDAQSKLIRRKIAAAEREKSRAEWASVDLNENDKTGVLSAIGTTMGQLVTGDWGRMAGAKTKEGDAVRKAEKEKAAAAELKIAELQEQLRKSEERAAAFRKEAENLRERRDKAGNSLNALDIESETARAAGRRGVETATSELAKRNAEIEKDRATLADAGTLKDSYNARIDEEKTRAQAAADRYKKEQDDVIAAQGRLDMLTANGGSRKEKSAALEALQKEKAEADEAKHEMEKVAAEVANTLQAITAQIKALASAVQKAESRLGQNQADAPEG